MNQPEPNSRPAPHHWFTPGSIIFMLFVLGMFVWGNLSTRGVYPRDKFCVSLINSTDANFLNESENAIVYVEGLPFAFHATRIWGGYPPHEAFFRIAFAFNVLVCLASLFASALAWSIWRYRRQGRRMFQFHLSTALILMLVAGALLGLNLLPSSQLRMEAPSTTLPYCYYGWPMQLYETLVSYSGAWGRSRVTTWNAWFGETDRQGKANLAFDILFCLSLVFFIGLACEAWIAWRAKPRKDSATS